MTDAAGSPTYSYDNANRLTAVTRGSNTFTYAYDVGGNLTSRTYPDSTATAYSYDADNRLATAASGGNTTSYSYDAAGHLDDRDLPSGNGYIETRTYDRAGRLIELKNANAGSTSSPTMPATLDPVGNPTQVARPAPSRSPPPTATTNTTGSRRSATRQAAPRQSDPFIRWTYDQAETDSPKRGPPAPPTTPTTPATSSPQPAATSYSYDANGNQTAAGSRTFSYDLANRLTSTTNGGTTTSYSYDGDGNRLTATTAGAPTKYLWDTNASAAPTTRARTRRQRQPDPPLHLRRPPHLDDSGGADYYYHYDTLGSVGNLTSANGTTEWTYGYEPFGNATTVTQNDPSAPANPNQFVGEYLDPSGLYNLRAREYEPSIGRLLSVDPAQQEPGSAHDSDYAYAGDAPTVMVDPSGKTLEPSQDATTAAQTATSSCARTLQAATGHCGMQIFRLTPVGYSPSGKRVQVVMDIVSQGVKQGIHWTVSWDWAAFRQGQQTSTRNFVDSRSGWGGNFQISLLRQVRLQHGSAFGEATFQIYTLWGPCNKTVTDLASW